MLLATMFFCVCQNQGNLCIPNSEWPLFKPAVGFWNKHKGTNNIHKGLPKSVESVHFWRYCFCSASSFFSVCSWLLNICLDLVLLFDLYLPGFPVSNASFDLLLLKISSASFNMLPSSTTVHRTKPGSIYPVQSIHCKTFRQIPS